MLTPNKSRALRALLTQPTKAAAAAEAGISPRTLRDYLADPEFQAEYKHAFSRLVTDATRQAQLALSPAINALRDIVDDDGESSSARIAAARTLLEYGLRLTELTDILSELESIEGESRVL